MRVRKKYERMNNVRVEERKKERKKETKEEIGRKYNWNMSLCRNWERREEEIGSGKRAGREK